MNALIWQQLPARVLNNDVDLRAQWDRLNACRLNLPFLSAAANATALNVFGAGREQLLVGRDSGIVRAMFIVVADGRLRWHTFQPSQVPLGAWVADTGLSPEALSRELMRGPLGPCLAVSITQVDPLMSAREADAADNLHADYIDTAWIDIVGSFDDYWAARGKNLRQNMRKQRNKLTADGVVTQMRVLRRPQEMRPALARYGALESAGWKSDQGTAIHPDNKQGRYYIRLFEEAAALGEAAIYEYLFADRTVAMNLCLLRGGSLVVLKTAYDETVKTLSPAFLLREEELQSFFAGDDIQRVEYYGRVMDWHTKLTGNKRTLYHLTSYRWAWLKRLAVRRAAAALASQPSSVPEQNEVPAVAVAAPSTSSSLPSPSGQQTA